MKISQKQLELKTGISLEEILKFLKVTAWFMASLTLFDLIAIYIALDAEIVRKLFFLSVAFRLSSVIYILIFYGVCYFLPKKEYIIRESKGSVTAQALNEINNTVEEWNAFSIYHTENSIIIERIYTDSEHEDA